MKTIILKVEYDGTDFYGFQKQTGKEESCPTVQGALEKIFAKLAGRHVVSKGAGRTDRGVHALGQIVSFVIPDGVEFPIPAKALVRLFNNALPAGIRVRAAVEMPGRFHALAHSRTKTYAYIVNYGEPDVFSARYSWHVWKKIDMERIREFLPRLVGKVYSPPFCEGEIEFEKPDVVHKVMRSFRVRDVRSKKKLVFMVEGEGFVYKMVRRMVGFLINYATGRFGREHAEKVLSDHSLRSTYVTAPACGLILYRVRYEDVPEEGVFIPSF